MKDINNMLMVKFLTKYIQAICEIFRTTFYNYTSVYSGNNTVYKEDSERGQHPLFIKAHVPEINYKETAGSLMLII